MLGLEVPIAHGGLAATESLMDSAALQVEHRRRPLPSRLMHVGHEQSNGSPVSYFGGYYNPVLVKITNV
jgi:hypothetical protein